MHTLCRFLFALGGTDPLVFIWLSVSCAGKVLEEQKTATSNLCVPRCPNPKFLGLTITRYRVADLSNPYKAYGRWISKLQSGQCLLGIFVEFLLTGTQFLPVVCFNLQIPFAIPEQSVARSWCPHYGRFQYRCRRSFPTRSRRPIGRRASLLTRSSMRR
jgi:hypothetical protein